MSMVLLISGLISLSWSTVVGLLDMKTQIMGQLLLVVSVGVCAGNVAGREMFKAIRAIWY